MNRVICSSMPTASKEHTCSLCECKIEKGRRYHSYTCIHDEGQIYVWKGHEECLTVARELEMFGNNEDGELTHDAFVEEIDDYIYGTHDDECLPDWLDLSIFGKVCKIMAERKIESVKQRL